MCNVIMTTEGDVGSISEMNARGWTVIPPDILPSYSKLDPDIAKQIVDEQDACLCAVDVEAVLDRHMVDYERDPFGWTVFPLRGDWGHSPEPSSED